MVCVCFPPPPLTAPPAADVTLMRSQGQSVPTQSVPVESHPNSAVGWSHRAVIPWVAARPKDLIIPAYGSGTGRLRNIKSLASVMALGSVTSYRDNSAR